MSIEGYSNSYTNNIEGNTTDTILQAEIDLIKYNITDITFDGTNKTTISNDVTITGVLAIPSFSNVSTTLTTLNSSVSTINTTLTGISYNNSTSQDLTTITNNVTIGTGKILSIPNYSSVENTLTSYNTSINTINTTLTDISYSSDTTTISNNLTLSTGKVLNIEGYPNVKTTLDNYNTSINTINTTLTDISFATDTTTINNNLTLSTGKILAIPNYPNVESTLTSLSTTSTTLTGISYDNTGSIDLTTISNNLTIGTGKVLSIPNYPNVESTLTSLTSSVSSLTASINYLNIMVFEDDFIDGFSSNPMAWASGGSGSVLQTSDEEYYMGIVRLQAGNDRTLYPSNTINSYFWNSFIRMDFCIRTISQTNLNVNYVIGLSDNNTGSGNTITWNYSTSVNGWEMKVNNVGLQSAPALTLTSYDWWFGSIVKLTGTKMLRFYLKNLTSGTIRDWSSVSACNDISYTANYRPYFRVTNTDGVGTKILDIDYVKLQYATGRPYTA